MFNVIFFTSVLIAPATSKTSAWCTVKISKHSKTMKTFGLRPRPSITFACLNTLRKPTLVNFRNITSLGRHWTKLEIYYLLFFFLYHLHFIDCLVILAWLLVMAAAEDRNETLICNIPSQISEACRQMFCNNINVTTKQ